MDLVEAARLFDGVPFKHQGRSIHGVDCIGLVVLAAREMGVYVQDGQGYSRIPDGKQLRAEMDRQLIRTSRGKNNTVYGDILLMAFEKYPQHVAIRTDRGIIHAYQHAGRVVEHVFSDKWQQRVRGVYTLG